LKRKEISSELEKYTGDGLSLEQTIHIVKQRSAFTMVDAVCCKKEERPDIHIDKSMPCPKFIPFSCTHGGPNGKCPNCGRKK
jgi:hypothetical protein